MTDNRPHTEILTVPANIKLDSVLSDLMGKSGRAMLEALIAGETNPTKLASLAHPRAKASPEEFRGSSAH